MARRGPPPTPSAILKLRGSWRGDLNRNEPAPPIGRPEAPELSEKARIVWDKACEILEAMGVLTKADGHQLERYCRYLVRWRECEDFIAKFGINYEVKSSKPKRYVKGKIVQYCEYPQVHESHRLAAELRRIEMNYGLTPSARSRINAAVEGKPDTPKVVRRARG